MNKGFLLLLLSALLWSLGGVLIKSVDWTPMGIAGTRSLIAVVLMFIFCRAGWQKLTWTAIPGALAYAATVVLFVLATKLTTAANAIFLQYTAPIYIAIIGPWYLQEKTSMLDWIFILVALSGVGLFFVDRLSLNGFIGVLAALASGLSFAWMTMLLRRQRHASPEAVLFLGNVATVLIALPWLVQPVDLIRNGPRLLALGVVQLTIPYLIYARAIRHVRALDAALISMIEPILNPIWVMLVTFEKPSLWSVMGGGLVLGSSFARTFTSARARTELLPSPEAVIDPTED